MEFKKSNIASLRNVKRDKCDVCLSEKLAIMKDKDSRSINKRTELMNKCPRHKV